MANGSGQQSDARSNALRPADTLHTVHEMIDLVGRHGAPDGVAEGIDQLKALCEERELPIRPEFSRPISPEFGRGVIEAVDQMDRAGQQAFNKDRHPGSLDIYSRAAVLQQRVQGTLGLEQPYNEVACFSESFGPDGPRSGSPRWSELNKAVAEVEQVFGEADGQEAPMAVRVRAWELDSTPGVGTEIPGDPPVPFAVCSLARQRVMDLKYAAGDVGYQLTSDQEKAVAAVQRIADVPFSVREPTRADVQLAVLETADAYGALSPEQWQGPPVPAEVRRAAAELRAVPGACPEPGERDEGGAPPSRNVIDAISEKAEALEHAARDAGYEVTARQQRAVAMVYEIGASPEAAGTPAQIRRSSRRRRSTPMAGSRSATRPG